MDEDLDQMTREELVSEVNRQSLDEQAPTAPRTNEPYEK